MFDDDDDDDYKFFRDEAGLKLDLSELNSIACWCKSEADCEEIFLAYCFLKFHIGSNNFMNSMTIYKSAHFVVTIDDEDEDEDDKLPALRVLKAIVPLSF